MVKPSRTWAEGARTSPGGNTDLAIKLPTYHTVAKNQAVPYPFATNPHLFITYRYSGSSENQNELVFRHVIPAGHATTRELMQRYRTEADAAIRKRLGINMFYISELGDTVTVVTIKLESTKGNGS